MFDVKAIRDDRAVFDRGWTSRGLDGPAITDVILTADADLRSIRTAYETAQARRNEASKLIGAAKKAGNEVEATELVAKVEALKGLMTRLEKADDSGLSQLLSSFPNIPADDVPQGVDEHGNVEQVNRRFGNPAELPAGQMRAPKDHVELGERLGMMDFEAAARMSGSRFVVLRRDLARLERALGQFMLDLQTREHEYEEVSPPLLVRDHAMFGTGQLPKFDWDSFATYSPEFDNAVGANWYVETEASMPDRAVELLSSFNGVGDRDKLAEALERAHYEGTNDLIEAMKRDFRSHFLIPTAEVSLTNLVREQITPEEQLPLRFTALTPCFRSEAGASGRDTRGMIRQ
ncbi:aminoacyl--tRNA ligase-related protein, partial [Caulobacter sp. S45]|uniref:aminoacyl--tRNA ligase-related protein n=1 Tax=Caulobacter sp. S45 TaxID=1641861 RepID=UPI0015766AAD